MNFGIHYPDRALSIVIGAAGMGAEPDKSAQFRTEVEIVAKRWETEGAEKFAPIYGSGPGRDARAPGWGVSLGMGLAQGVALMPGVSRSGITMTIGRMGGLSRIAAARLLRLHSKACHLAETRRVAIEFL